MAQKLRTPPAFPVDSHLVFSVHAGWLTTTCHGNSRRPLILFRTLSVVDIAGDTPPWKTDFYSLSSYQLKKNCVASFGTLSTPPFPQWLCLACICTGLVHAVTASVTSYTHQPCWVKKNPQSCLSHPQPLGLPGFLFFLIDSCSLRRGIS